MGRFICVGFGLIMGILGIRMIDTRRTMRTLCPPNKDTFVRNIVSGKCTHVLLVGIDDRYEDVSDMKRAMYHYERGAQQGDSACLYVS